jgi:hypothetical protein
MPAISAAASVQPMASFSSPAPRPVGAEGTLVALAPAGGAGVRPGILSLISVRLPRSVWRY